MQLGWVDHSRQERETIRELLKLLGESASLDELGVGIVRDSISDRLYPGTSVLHTRAKYYILIPELFQKAMKSELKTMAEVRNLINSDQDKIARALRRVVDEETGTRAAGIIGGRSDRAVKMKPAMIYWNALRTMGILCNPTLSFDDACTVVANYHRKNQNITIKQESEEDGPDAEDANRGRPVLFSVPCRQDIDEYIAHPTLQLTREEAEYLREQFLSVPVMKDTLMEYCLENRQSYLDQQLDEIKVQPGMPEVLRHNLKLAVEFADFIYGAYTIYNLRYFENGGEYADDEEKEKLEEQYREWKQSSPGLPHREEILGLVSGHEDYKKELRKFLVGLEAAVNANPTEVCSEAEKELVKNRELACKKKKAKIGKKDMPFQEIQSSPMNYRHGTGQRIIEDILKGLVRDDGKAQI